MSKQDTAEQNIGLDQKKIIIRIKLIRNSPKTINSHKQDQKKLHRTLKTPTEKTI